MALNFCYRLETDGSFTKGVEFGPDPYEGTGSLWADFEGLSEEDVRTLKEVFGFHDLAVEDCLHKSLHPKAEQYDRYLFTILFGVEPGQAHRPFSTAQFAFFVGTNFLVTVHERPSQAVERVKESAEKNAQAVMGSPCHAMYRTMDEIVDGYFPVLERMEEGLERIESEVFERFSEGVLRRVFSAKKEVLALRRLLVLEREVLNSLTHRSSPYVQTGTQTYLRDVYDHLIRLYDSTEINRELLFSALEAYASQVSNKMNAIMKTLSIVATIMLPLTLIASIFGMNFEAIPGLRSEVGFWATMGGMAVVSLLLVLYFRRKRWL